MVCLLAELAYVMLSPFMEFFQLVGGYGGKDAASVSPIQPEVLGPLQPHPWGLSAAQSSAQGRDITLGLERCPGC